jgi:adenylate cyclase
MNKPRYPSSRLYTPLLFLLLAVVAWLAWARFHGGPPAPARQPEAPGSSAVRQVYHGPPNSLAVLPFDVIVGGQEQAAQAEGFAGEILESLIEMPALRPTARSSSFFFRGGGGDLRVIAERLQSAHLLQGDWRSEDEGVVLALSLYDAREGREAWRNEYSAPLPDLLAMRGALCADIVAALPVPPPGEPCPAAAVAPQAWLHYVEGLRYADPSGERDLPRAAEALRSALAVDPAYAAARLRLAEIWLHPAWSSEDADGDPVAEARTAAQQVLDEDPGSARAWGLLSYIRHQYDWDWPGAVDAGRRAVALRAGDAGILGVASLAMSTVGEFGEAQDLLEESVRRDPLNLGSRLRLGLLQEFRGDYEAALASYRQVLALNPDYPGGHAYRARVKLLQGKFDSALRESEQESDPFWQRYAAILALSAQDEPEQARAMMQDMIAETGDSAAFQIAEILAFGGDVDGAFDWLGRAYTQRDAGLASTMGNRFLENLHADDRWPEWLARLGLPEEAPR